MRYEQCWDILPKQMNKMGSERERAIRRTLLTRFEYSGFTIVQVLPSTSDGAGWMRVGIIDEQGIKLDHALIASYGYDPEDILADVNYVINAKSSLGDNA